MIKQHTCGSSSKIRIWKDTVDVGCNTKKKFCVLQKKVLSFGLNRTTEVRLTSSAKLNVRLVTRVQFLKEFCKENGILSSKWFFKKNILECPKTKHINLNCNWSRLFIYQKTYKTNCKWALKFACAFISSGWSSHT